MPKLVRRLLPRRSLDNRAFWNDRYRANPILGSGVGSRGDLAAQKRELITKVWQDYGQGSVLDVGFGDLEMLDVSLFPQYTGVDISDVAVERARQRYPQHTFIHADLTKRREPAVPSADLVLCFDVVIHQFSEQSYRRMVNRLVARARRVGLVSGYDKPPRKGGPIIAYHEPLSETLRSAGASGIERCWGYRGVNVLRFEPGGR